MVEVELKLDLKKYLIHAIVVVSSMIITGVIVYAMSKHHKTQISNLETLLSSSRTAQASLQTKLSNAERDNNELRMKITQLTTVNEEETQPTRLLKNREEIKAYVNRKRRTIQDDIDEEYTETEEEFTDIPDGRDKKDSNEIIPNKNNDDEVVDEDVDEEHLNDIMNLIKH